MLDLELQKKIRDLTLEYDRKSQPLLEKQSEIVSGRQITEEELSLADEYLTAEDKSKKSEALANKEPIKEFWLRTLLNSEVLAEEIKEKDEDALKHLVSVYYKNEENSNNFTVYLKFEQNEFFTNEVLSKKFYINDEDEVTKTEGTVVNWKEGKNLTVKTIKKTQKNKKTNAKRVVTKEVQDESFFNFFKDEDVKIEKEDDDDGEDEGDMKLQIDQDIGRTLVEEVIPYSVEYFLGVKQGEEDDDLEAIDEHDECDSHDDQDQDEDSDEKPKKSKKDKKQHKKSTDSTGSKKGDKADKGDKGGAGEKPECK